MLWSDIWRFLPLTVGITLYICHKVFPFPFAPYWLTLCYFIGSPFDLPYLWDGVDTLYSCPRSRTSLPNLLNKHNISFKVCPPIQTSIPRRDRAATKPLLALPFTWELISPYFMWCSPWSWPLHIKVLHHSNTTPFWSASPTLFTFHPPLLFLYSYLSTSIIIPLPFTRHPPIT